MSSADLDLYRYGDKSSDDLSAVTGGEHRSDLGSLSAVPLPRFSIDAFRVRRGMSVFDTRQDKMTCLV